MDKSVKFRIELETNGRKVLGNLSMSVGEFKDAIGEAVKETRTLDSSLKELTEKSLLLSSMNTIIGQLSSAVGTLADEYNTFDKGMRAVSTMAGKDAGGLAMLKGQVEELASVIPLTRKELSDGLYQVISNGVPEDNWIEFLHRSARSAVGGIADLGQTVTVTATIIKNYGLEWSAAAEIQDKIQMTARNGVTSFEQLAAALPRVTGNAASLGVSIDELMASFATLTGVSGNTAEVSTQLAAIFTALVKPSSEATEMAREMGVQFDAAAIRAAGGMHGFLASLSADIQQYAAAHGMLEQEIYGRLFSSAEALRALIPLTGELSDTFSANVAAMADSTGTMDRAFSEMAGSGENVAVVLRNQMAVMLDWAGSLASGLQPYMTFVATGGQAIAGLTLMAASTRKAAVAVLALAQAHRSNAAVSAMAAVHTRVVAVAQRLLAAGSVTATAGTWALNAAVAALYATLTLGISAAVSGLVALFSSMGNEAVTAAGKVDVLKDSADAFARATSDTRAELDMETVALSNLIRQQKDETSKVEELNNRYGEALGHHKTAAEWYDTLVAKSRVYCTQMGYEAQARVLASQIAAKELEREQKQTQTQRWGQQYMDGRGRVQYGWQKEGVGENVYRETVAEVTRLSDEIRQCRDKYDSCITHMVSAQNELSASVSNTTRAVTWQKMSYNDLGKAIEKQKALVGSLAGTGDTKAKAESAKLRQMEARYKQLGETFALASGTSRTTAGSNMDGKKLMANADSYKALSNNIQYYQTQLERTSSSEVEEIHRLSGLKKECEDAREAIKRMLDEAGRPTALDTLEDMDREIQYQQQLRQRASDTELASIDREIQRLKTMRTAFEDAAAADLRIEEIHTYEQLDDQMARYERRLKTATEGSREEIQRHITSLRELKGRWDDTLSALDMPEDISRLNTLDSLEQAISYYSDRQKKASAGEITSLQRTLDLLEAKKGALQRLTQLPSMQNELADLSALSGKKLRMELELIGLDGVKEKIRSLQKMLDDSRNPLDAEQRQEVEQMMTAWQDYEKQIRRNSVTLQQTWGEIKGISSGVQGITDALQGNGSAWEKTMAVVDGAIALYEGISGIVAIIQALTGVTHLQTAAKVAETAATTSASVAQGTETAMQTAALGEKIALTAANKAATASFLELAAAQYFAAHAYIPFAGFGIAAGFATAAAATVKTLGAMPFANGGLVYGPTLGLVGEYSGAAANPEVIAPLDKLRGLLADTHGGNTQGSEVRFRIDGRTLVGLLERETRLSSRT